MHFDGRAARFNGDHEPIDDRCPTSTWQPGDYIVDTYTVIAGGAAFAEGHVRGLDRVLHGHGPELEEHADQRGAARHARHRPIA